MMGWLRIVCFLISIAIFSYLFFQALNFRKELKEASNENMRFSKVFVHKWERKFSRGTLLIIIGSIFGLVAIILSY